MCVKITESVYIKIGGATPTFKKYLCGSTFIINVIICLNFHKLSLFRYRDIAFEILYTHFSELLYKNGRESLPISPILTRNTTDHKTNILVKFHYDRSISTQVMALKVLRKNYLKRGGATPIVQIF